MKFIQCTAFFAMAIPAFFAVSSQADERVPVKVVVITTFQNGKDDDPTGGEFGNWVLNLPLRETIPFPQGYHHLRYNPELQVLGIVTGEGKSHAAASIMGLGMDPRFDLSKAYWIVAAIGGVDPNKGSVASTAWAKFVVDGDLAYEIDARQIPRRWSTGLRPLGTFETLWKALPTVQFQWCSAGFSAQCLTRRLGFQIDQRHPIAG